MSSSLNKLSFVLLIIIAILATIFFPPELLGDHPYLRGPAQASNDFTGPTLADPDTVHEAPEEIPEIPKIEIIQEPKIVPNSIHSPESIQECRSRYWIISSKHLEQDQLQPGQKCALKYFECHGCTSFQPISRNRYLNSINPEIPVCIITHGSFTSPETLHEKTARIVSWLSAAAPCKAMQYIFFTWPSESEFPAMPRMDILRLGIRASNNGFYLANAICEIPGTSQITLIGHSHGSRISASALHLLGRGTVNGLQFPHGRDNQRRIRAVFMAAAIDHHWLNPGERFDRAIHRSEGILILVTRKDWALCLYPFRRVCSNRALGKIGLTKKDRRELGCHNHKLFELDVTDNVSHGHTLSNYYEAPPIAWSIAPFVNFSHREELHSQPSHHNSPYEFASNRSSHQ